MSSIPIFTLTLLEIHIPKMIKLKSAFFKGMTDSLNEHSEIFERENVPLNILHNDIIAYSGIQFGDIKGSPSITAIGEQEVKALKLWFEIVKKENKLPLNNIVEINETYTPEFLNRLKKYRVRTLLISDDLAKELNDVQDKFARYDRMEKYLYGNIQRFMQHIGYKHDKDSNFLKVSVTDMHYHESTHQVYHDQKKTAIDIRFMCNFLLPQMVRLGQSTALGYGKLTHV